MHNIFGAADTGHSNGLEPLLMEFLGGNFLQINWLCNWSEICDVHCQSIPTTYVHKSILVVVKSLTMHDLMVSLKQR